MSTKNDPGPFDCYARLAPDEPYFVLRAKDPAAPETIEQWVKERVWTWHEAHADESIPAEYWAKLTEALRTADAMRTWRSIHFGDAQAGPERR